MGVPATCVVIALAGCGRIGFDESADGGVDAMPVIGFSRVAAYSDFTCAVHTGRLYCWGANDQGQLGVGDSADRTRPTEVMLPPGELVGIALGDRHGCAIVDEDLHCWGAQTMDGAIDGPVTAVAAGRDFTCAIAGQTYCWGDNDRGQLGDGTQTSRDQPMPVLGGPFVAIDGGDDHACALGADRKAMCWGHNDDGALGTGMFTPNEALVPVPVAGALPALPHIAGWHSCALVDGRVLCWGRNMEGALGTGNPAQPSATPIDLGVAEFQAIATGGGPADFDSTCAITAFDMVSCWGAGGDGRLGHGGTSNTVDPVSVDLPGQPLALAIGYAHACAVLDDGSLYCWGRGTRGQLGDGTSTTQLRPVKVLDP